LDYWISFSITLVEKDATFDTDMRMASLSKVEIVILIAFMCEIWALFPEQVQDNPENPNMYMRMLKRGNRDKFRPLRVSY